MPCVQKFLNKIIWSSYRINTPLSHIRHKLTDIDGKTYVECFAKFRDEKQIFKSLETKNEIHVYFKPENNNLVKVTIRGLGLAN